MRIKVTQSILFSLRKNLDEEIDVDLNLLLYFVIYFVFANNIADLFDSLSQKLFPVLPCLINYAVVEIDNKLDDEFDGLVINTTVFDHQN